MHQLPKLSYADYPTTQDTAGFKDGANGLARLIQSTELPLVGAIYGKWGAGKSSFLNMVIEELLKEPGAETDSNKYLVVMFEPWKIERSKQALYDLVCSIHHAATNAGLLSDSDVRAKNLFEKMNDLGLYSVSEIAKMGVSDVIDKNIGGGKELSELLGRLFKKSPKEIARQRISAAHSLSTAFHEYLSAIAKIPLIIIDDLDRCDPSTVVAVLEGMKLYLQEPNARIVYLLAMDHEMVTKAICREHGYRNWEDGWQYLSKICNLNYYIPRPVIDGLITELSLKLARADDKLDLFWDFLRNEQTHQVLYQSGLYLPRRLKKVIREFHMAVSPNAFGFTKKIKELIQNNSRKIEIDSEKAEIGCYQHLLGVFVLREAFPDLYMKLVNKTNNKRASLLLNIGIQSATIHDLDNRMALVQETLTQWRLSEVHEFFENHTLLDIFSILFNPESFELEEPTRNQFVELILDPMLDYMMGR